MSEEEAVPVSDTASGETSDQTTSEQQEDERQPQEAANEQGESGTNMEQQEEQVGKSVVEDDTAVKDSEGEGGKEGATKDSEKEEGKGEGEKEEGRKEEEGEKDEGERRKEEGGEKEEGRKEEEGEKEEGRKEEEGEKEGEKEEGGKEEGGKDVKEGKEADSQQGTAAEGGIAEEPAPEESTVTTEEQTDIGEKGGGDEVIEQERSEGGRGEGGDEKEGRGHDIVMGELSTVEEKPTSEQVDGDVAVTSSPDHRLVSASKMAVQPSPLENITEEDEDVEEDTVNREELLTRCKEALHEQCRLRNENLQLQHKIAEYLTYKKVEEKLDPGRNVTDQEKRYLQCMSALDQLEVELEQVKVDWLSRVEEMKGLCDSKQREVKREELDFLKYQREEASEAVDSRSGRKLASTDISKMQSVQQTKDQAVVQARLENIKLTNKIERLKTQLKQKEELAEGLHMIDFEQLKISNVDLGEKVEERNEDITKLTGKVRATVEVLTHVKEKLHFLQDENEKKKEHLELLDSELAKRRDVLTRLKQVRDSLRLDNQRLRQRGGLVCHSGLLRDFEDRQDQNAELQSMLDRLKSQHTQNSMQCAGLRRKIENARLLHHHLH